MIGSVTSAVSGVAVRVISVVAVTYHGIGGGVGSSPVGNSTIALLRVGLQNRHFVSYIDQAADSVKQHYTGNRGQGVGSVRSLQGVKSIW